MSPPPAKKLPYRPPNLDFLGKPAPPGYVAGVGRGATGFTTRSDIGPAREPVASTSGATASLKRKVDNDDQEGDLNDSNYDEFNGYGGSLFGSDPYDKDDVEADRIYAEIDKYMAGRSKANRNAKESQELDPYFQRRKKIQEQFSDIKAQLKHVTVEEWESIPEVGDARNRKQRVARQDKYTPAPDSLLAHQARLATGGERVVYFDPKANASDSDEEDAHNPNAIGIGSQTGDGQKLNIGDMSEYRSSIMSMQLSRISERYLAHKNDQQINAQDYLKKLESQATGRITDTATVKDKRKLYSAIRASNPTFPEAWIISARLEEEAGHLTAARKMVMKGCYKCPTSVDLWLEAIRLQPPDYANALVREAIHKVPRSEKLWLKAAELENRPEYQRRIFEKARTLIPKSELFWRRSIELEPPEQARALLQEAVLCCPNCVEFWLALAKLSPYNDAVKVLKEANEKNPKDRSIWLTGAKLQEHVGKNELVERIIKLSVSDLAEKGVQIERADWLREAADADRANYKITCREIIRRIIGWNISEPERLRTWLADANDFIASGAINCARAVFETIVEDKAFAKMESVWQEYAKFERQYGDNRSLVSVLKRAVEREHCHSCEALWLALAAEKRPNLTDCRLTLSDALAANPDSETIVLAAVELECSERNYQEARRILADACKSAKTPQLVMRAAKLESTLGNIEEATRMLNEAISGYKNYPDFFLSLGQIEEQNGAIEKAKKTYSDGLTFNPTSVDLWISIAHLEEKTNSIARARSRLEIARLRNPKSVQLWLEAAQLEWRQYLLKAGSATHRSRPDMVHTLLAKGIKECKDQPDVDKLHDMQTEITKRKFA